MTFEAWVKRLKLHASKNQRATAREYGLSLSVVQGILSGKWSGYLTYQRRGKYLERKNEKATVKS
jgi:hypothetical protein